MSELIEALVLGIVQGLSEFLPISSSGHIEIAKVLLRDDSVAEQSMLVTVVLHFATALATIFVFRKDILEIISLGLSKEGQEQRKFVFKIIISMLPAVIIGLVFEDFIESLFSRNLLLVGAMLLVTGVLLLIADLKKEAVKEISFSSAFIIGVSQAIAILPGISRSGATISTSILLGVDREKAARFSFLMVIPIIFGKMAKDLLAGDFVADMPSIPYLLVGFFAAFFVGIMACIWMIDIVKKTKLKYFAVYCFIVATILIIYSLAQ